MKTSGLLRLLLCGSLLLSGCGGGAGGGDEDDDFDNDGDTDASGTTTTLPTIGGSHRVLAFNDLGMHCADLDYSNFVILPPFNVVHAQVIERGAEPRILSNSQIALTYKAQTDASGSINSTSQNQGGAIQKSNFWDTLPNSTTTYAEALFGARLAADMGLLGQAMPGIDNPYVANDPQPFSDFDPTKEWFSAEGIPILPVDDFGQTKPYPLMRVEARDRVSGEVLASVDTVLPVAAEADCQTCHEAGRVGAQRAGISYEFPSDINDPNSVLQAAKLNILLLHDFLHGTSLMDQRPVLCAGCHYSTALDLDGLGPQGSQIGKPTLSRVMHGHHGELTDNGVPVFPPNGSLEETCYHCHPGKVTKCLRGAMGGAGIVCQSCHGDMLAVGNPSRQPWIDEPRCESCHTGDAVNHLGASIRLTQAWEDGDATATPRIASNKRFAENNGELYRNSLGHGGVACEGCHGSTHAIWPNANPASNDNVAATQLQGHSGTIIECSTCHGTAMDSQNTLGGPHGMHPVGENTRFARGGHEDMAERNPTQCAVCHGPGSRSSNQGTVLSEAKADRNLRGTLVRRGEPVGCSVCH